MPNADTEPGPKIAKTSKFPLIIGLVLALIGGAGGFYVTWSGKIFGTASDDPDAKETRVDTSADLSFVPVEPLVVSLGQSASARHLRFRAELEVPSIYQSEVTKLLPRVVDVLNSYLRALEPGDLENMSALVRLRAQMLRRVQVVVGQERVNDLLVMEFVLN